MTSHHQKSRFVTSRFVLVVAVVIASFLAAFLGQVLITQLSLSPSILPQPGIIVRSTGADSAALRTRADGILNREGSAFVSLYESVDPLSARADGWVMSSDGWVAYLDQADFTPAFVRLGSGVSERITATIADPASPLRFVKMNQDRLTAVTLAQQADLKALDSILSFSGTGLYSTTQVTGVSNFAEQAVQSSDQLTRMPMIVTGMAIGSALYDSNSDFIGLALLDTERSVSAVIPAEHIRSRLLDVLRTGAIQSPSMGVSYVDLGLHPTTFVTQRSGSWIPPQTYSNQPVLPTTAAAYKAGLRQGDVITAVDGIPLSDRFTLTDSVLQAKVGDSLELTVSRRGTPLTITVELQTAS